MVQRLQDVCYCTWLIINVAFRISTWILMLKRQYFTDYIISQALGVVLRVIIRQSRNVSSTKRKKDLFLIVFLSVFVLMSVSGFVLM